MLEVKQRLVQIDSGCWLSNRPAREGKEPAYLFPRSGPRQVPSAFLLEQTKLHRLLGMGLDGRGGEAARRGRTKIAEMPHIVSRWR